MIKYHSWLQLSVLWILHHFGATDNTGSMFPTEILWNCLKCLPWRGSPGENCKVEEISLDVFLILLLVSFFFKSPTSILQMPAVSRCHLHRDICAGPCWQNLFQGRISPDNGGFQFWEDQLINFSLNYSCSQLCGSVCAGIVVHGLISWWVQRVVEKPSVVSFPSS